MKSNLLLIAADEGKFGEIWIHQLLLLLGNFHLKIPIRKCEKK